MKNRNFIVFIALVFLTCITYFSSFFSFGIVFLLIITFIKGFLIASFFMELKEVRLKYSIIVYLWIFFVLSLIAFAFLF